MREEELKGANGLLRDQITSLLRSDLRGGKAGGGKSGRGSESGSDGSVSWGVGPESTYTDNPLGLLGSALGLGLGSQPSQRREDRSRGAVSPGVASALSSNTPPSPAPPAPSGGGLFDFFGTPAPKAV